MRRLLLALVVTCTASALLGATARPASAIVLPTDNAACSFSIVLSPANEPRPPGTTDPVESRALGFTILSVRANGTVRWTTVIVNPFGERFFAGHIHRGPAGVNGPVVVPLFQRVTTEPIIIDSGTTVADEDLAADICANPDQYYVNYHTVADPIGAVRGQLA
jgi:hypothetical protein